MPVFNIRKRSAQYCVESAKFRHIIFGASVRIYTDHSNLQFLASSPLSRLQRWFIIIDEFKPLILHIPGEQNAAADYLSRDPGTIDMVLASDSIPFFPLDESTLLQAQKNDTENSNTSRLSTNTANGLVVLKNTGIPYIPEALRQATLDWFHESFQHPGITKTFSTMNRLVYWPGLFKDIVSFINGCQICCTQKAGSKSYGLLKSSLNSLTPWTHIAVDILGPFNFFIDNGIDELSPFKYSLSIIDICTRFVELVPLAGIDAIAVSKALDKAWLCRYPRPLFLTSDQGTQFLSSEFSELLLSYGISHRSTTSYNPTANSIVERIHLSIGNSIRCSQNPNLEDVLPAIAWALNGASHRILGCSPAELVFGCNLLNPNIQIDSKKSLQNAIANKLAQNKKTLKSENAKRINHVFQPNDLVFLKNPSPTKLSPRYFGPFPVISVSSENNTLLIDKGTHHERINFRRAKPFLKEGQDVV